MISQETIEIISDLAVKLLFGRLTSDEQLLLDQWISISPDNKAIFDELVNKEAIRRGLQELQEINKEELVSWEKLYSRLQFDQPVVKPARIVYMKWYIAASVILLLLIAGTWFLIPEKPAHKTLPKVTGNDVPASPNSLARLVLADGTVIPLDSAGTGMLAQQGGASISKKDDQIIYTRGGQTPADTILYNTAATSRGGKCTVVLPDGSKAVMNAASSITFPVAFAPRERVVKVTGEVYFEVVHNPKFPFIVKLPAAQKRGNALDEVEVKGTRFNVNAYDNEDILKVTLLNGAIGINRRNLRGEIIAQRSSLTTGGQQAQLYNGRKIDVKKVDTASLIAWRNDEFNFTGDQDLETVMRQIERWYNVTVLYEKPVPDIQLIGKVSRKEPLSTLLGLFNETGEIHFELKGKYVVVKKK